MAADTLGISLLGARSGDRIGESMGTNADPTTGLGVLVGEQDILAVLPASTNTGGRKK